jgi:hypothetical protein
LLFVDEPFADLALVEEEVFADRDRLLAVWGFEVPVRVVLPAAAAVPGFRLPKELRLAPSARASASSVSACLLPRRAAPIAALTTRRRV